MRHPTRSRASRGSDRSRVSRAALLLRRWVIERSFTWCGHSRQLRKDYEACTKYSESYAYLIAIYRLLWRIGKDLAAKQVAA